MTELNTNTSLLVELLLSFEEVRDLLVGGENSKRILELFAQSA